MLEFGKACIHLSGTDKNNAEIDDTRKCSGREQLCFGAGLGQCGCRLISQARAHMKSVQIDPKLEASAFLLCFKWTLPIQNES